MRIIGAFVVLCMLASCTSIEASNDYIAIETCVSWERA